MKTDIDSKFKIIMDTVTDCARAWIKREGAGPTQIGYKWLGLWYNMAFTTSNTA